MHRQAGDLVIDKGIAVRGLIIRPLVFPENLSGSDVVLPGLHGKFLPGSYVISWTSITLRSMPLTKMMSLPLLFTVEYYRKNTGLQYDAP